MKKKYPKQLIIIILALITSLSFSQEVYLASPLKHVDHPPACELIIAEEARNISIVRSQFVKDRMEGRQVPCSTFIVDFGIGFNAFPEAEAAFQFAVDIWANSLESSVPIRVSASFDPAADNNLGSAGTAFRLELNGRGMPDNTVYPAALAEKLLGRDADGDDGTSTDIFANFNSGRTDWYFGLDAQPGPGQFDFVTIVLHELGHGLGVQGFGDVNVTSSIGSIRRDDTTTLEPIFELVSIWDQFIQGSITTSTAPVLDTSIFPDPSNQLRIAFTNGQLASFSPAAMAQNGDVPPRTFAPNPFNRGSSYSHWDNDTFSGTINGLMTPFATRGVATHRPGPITLGFFEDMGWTLCNNVLSTDDALAETTISINPNPFTETISISLPSNLRNDNFNVSIIDLNGRAVINQDMETINGEIILSNLSTLKSSLYFITIESLDSGASFTNKIIKR